MRNLLSLILVFVFSASLFSQDDTTKVAFVAYWDVGDTYEFKVTKAQQQWDENEMTKDELNEYFATFTVLEQSEDSYTISWSYKNNFDKLLNIPEGTSEEFIDLATVDIIYKTTEVGDFLEILNWEEVGENMNNLFDQIVEYAGKNDEKIKGELSKMMGSFREIYSSKQGIELLVMKEIQYFHFFMGVEFEVNEPIHYKDEIPNMFGGKPIKANAKITFEEVDFENSFCVIKQEMDLDQKDTKAILQQVLTKMNLSSKDVKKALKKGVFEIKDRNIFEYHYFPCIPHRIEAIRESNFDINNDKRRRVDSIIIELVYEDEE